MKLFIQRWLITTLAVLVAASVVQGIRYDTVTALFVASLLLGILNALLRPALLLLSLPLLIFSMGIFVLVINAGLLYLVGRMVKDFHVDGFWPAFWGALLISVVSMFANTLFGLNPKRAAAQPGSRPPTPPPSRPGEGQGPVIDV